MLKSYKVKKPKPKLQPQQQPKYKNLIIDVSFFNWLSSDALLFFLFCPYYKVH